MQSKNERDKAVLHRRCKELKELIRKVKNKSFQQYLQTLSPAKHRDYTLRKAIRKLKYVHRSAELHFVVPAEVELVPALTEHN